MIKWHDTQSCYIKVGPTWKLKSHANILDEISKVEQDFEISIEKWRFCPTLTYKNCCNYLNSLRERAHISMLSYFWLFNHSYKATLALLPYKHICPNFRSFFFGDPSLYLWITVFKENFPKHSRLLLPGKIKPKTRI